MKNSKLFELSVIVPCFNEEDNVDRIVSEILALFKHNGIKGEVVLIDDGSHDKTKVKIEGLSSRFENVIGISHSRNLGIVETWHSGLKNSRGRYVVTIDADLQYSPQDIMLLYKEIIADGYDLVQGWRRESLDKHLFRKFLSRILSFMLNILFFTWISDIKSGFVIYKRETFFRILKYRNRYKLFQHFFILCAIKEGCRFHQIPITFYPRLKGESFIKKPILFSFQVLSDIPRAILDFGIAERLKTRRKS
ncbi:glycosyltransferase family 2 protein [Candidatus Omnitrophota bacterium]